ncbi:glycosyltransferase [Candidatus Pantoea soli]|uniref:Glycosyltransferase n=1 Tax=Candidatus Pantoea soli TaxID=3098669 RepID=A0A518XGQ4_9GAMM|nr:glycosyltransferase [Pantoea soli]QDY43381.1 glycosyltransferase [Pantoea soli]
MDRPRKALFISFDAVALSGITVEATKIAIRLCKENIRCYLDLGYDIKIDKGNFGRAYSREETSALCHHFTLVRHDAIRQVAGYTPDNLKYLHDRLITRSPPAHSMTEKKLLAETKKMANAVADKLWQKWTELDIDYLIIENGTLPDNIIFTRALYLAIARYGKDKQAGRFVLWRDHDLMWNSESTSSRYGAAPWPHAVKPRPSPYITYVTLNQALAARLSAWCQHQAEIGVLRNTYCFDSGRPRKPLRQLYQLQPQDKIIARTTRLIPAKRLDRDIYLLHALNRALIDRHQPYRVYLMIAGDPREDPEHVATLMQLISALKLTPYVIFFGAVNHDFMEQHADAITIQDIYEACDLVSFLTAWDYDSYGNPVGEAISHQRCYIATRYEYYHEVYGQYGFEGELMDISAENDNLPDADFIQRVAALLEDDARRAAIAARNYQKGKSLLSDDIFRQIFHVS